MDPITWIVTPIAWLFSQPPLTIFTAVVVMVGGVAFAYLVTSD